jgi:hypothetical protein
MHNLTILGLLRAVLMSKLLSLHFHACSHKLTKITEKILISLTTENWTHIKIIFLTEITS